VGSNCAQASPENATNNTVANKLLMMRIP
jgi:hypothetical protein